MHPQKGRGLGVLHVIWAYSRLRRRRSDPSRLAAVTGVASRQNQRRQWSLERGHLSQFKMGYPKNMKNWDAENQKIVVDTSHGLKTY